MERIKKNTLDVNTVQPDDVVLVHTRIGFTWRYLNLLWHRMCRANVSATAEASSILLADPLHQIGHTAKNQWGSGAGVSITEKRLQQCIHKALFIFLRLKDGTTDFKVDDPVPDDDPIYGVPLKETYIIYNEPQLDKHLQRYGKLDVVTDGNQPLSRTLCDDEKTGLRRLQGRPSSKVLKKPAASVSKKPAASNASQQADPPKKKRKTKRKSRCIAVTSDEQIAADRTRTGGLFGTVSMHIKKGGGGFGNQILQLAEMKTVKTRNTR